MKQEERESIEDNKIEERITQEENLGYHWADGIADQIIAEKPDAKIYTCAAGITPSGYVHIGNFREIITNDLIARALKNKGKNVRFIYSWDDFDRLRKIPSNLPNKELLEQYLGMPITKVRDTFGCHESYAQHFEKEVEIEMPKFGINPEYLYQAEKYMNCEYAEKIKEILEKKDKIKEILEKYKTELVNDEWWPIKVYCEKCMRDETKVISWDGSYILGYECKCGYNASINFKEKGLAKLPWRIDWPMRWNYEGVDFEPGGKEHSTPGGSRTTAKEIYETIYSKKAPLYLKYDFIVIKGQGGKMSSSLGNVIKPKECLEIYEPEILRYLFAKTRPNTEFAIAFDEEAIKIYSEYDRLEEEYFLGALENKQKRIYELSQISQTSKKKVFAPQFRQIVELVQIKNEEEILGYFTKEITCEEDRNRTIKRIVLAKNWLKQAPEKFVFKIKENAEKEALNGLSEKQISSLKELRSRIREEKTEQEIIQDLKEICTNNSIDPKEFFRVAYLIIIGKDRGPKLSTIILIAREKVINLLNQIN
ncbi:MAG: lysine--tRNA ligase [archaeon]